MHSTAPLLFRYVACGVGGTENGLRRAAFMTDLHQANTDTDVEYPVQPDESIVGNCFTDVIGDLSPLIQRAADEQ